MSRQEKIEALLDNADLSGITSPETTEELKNQFREFTQAIEEQQ